MIRINSIIQKWLPLPGYWAVRQSSIKYYYAVFVFLMPFVKHSQASQMIPDVITRGEYSIREVVINGASNINNFTLKYSQENEKEFSLQSEDFQNSKRGKIVFPIPVEEIEAGNRNIKKDFASLVKGATYPDIIIELHQEDVLRIINGERVLNASMDLFISGQYRNYSAPVSIKEEDNEFIISGKIKLLLTDFGLVPPEKFWGLIKIKDEVKIDFIISFAKKTNKVEA